MAPPRPPITRHLAALPLPVVLLGLAGGLMLVPALYAAALHEHRVGRVFLHHGLLVLLLTGLLGLATRGGPRRLPVRSQLAGFVAAYLVLPPVLALPLWRALPGSAYGDAWFEMLSCLTTTGATVLDPALVPAPVHLWRGLVGWAGGFLVLVAAAGILSRLNLGGYELFAPRALGRLTATPPQAGPSDDAGWRLQRQARRLLPAYAGFTLALWLGLLLAGDPGLVALMHAMAALSTSGVTPLAGLAVAPSGMMGEALLVAGLAVALSRRLLPGTVRQGPAVPLWRDPELRLAAALIVLVPLALFLRHWLTVATTATPNTGGAPWLALHALWGALFTSLSYLTTTGMASTAWAEAAHWSGMAAPGFILLGLAMVGGGIATTAGGVTLLRVYALANLAENEIARLVEPAAVVGAARHRHGIHHEGAFVAFVFFMLFALTLGGVNLALAALGLGFEEALVLSIAAISTTGPMAETASIVPTGWAGLTPAVKAVLAAAMVAGRLETLAVLALILPAAWRN